MQSQNCCPLYNKFYDLPQTEAKPTIAEGIAISGPPRLDDMVAAVRESGGSVMTVTDDEIKAARHVLGHMGIYVEDTSAVVAAASRRYFKSGINNMRKVVIPLTGTGLKQ